MTIELFCTLLLGFGTSTTLVVEFIKSFLEKTGKTVSASSLSLVTGALVGAGGMVLYFIMANIAFTPANLIWIVGMAIANIMGSQLGYDKIVAVVKQMSSKKEEA